MRRARGSKWRRGRHARLPRPPCNAAASCQPRKLLRITGRLPSRRYAAAPQHSLSTARPLLQRPAARVPTSGPRCPGPKSREIARIGSPAARDPAGPAVAGLRPAPLAERDLAGGVGLEWEVGLEGGAGGRGKCVGSREGAEVAGRSGFLELQARKAGRWRCKGRGEEG